MDYVSSKRIKQSCREVKEINITFQIGDLTSWSFTLLEIPKTDRCEHTNAFDTYQAMKQHSQQD
jgi:hypothetical protein